MALDTAPELSIGYVSSTQAGIENLASFGFRPDPNVAFDIQLPTGTPGFVAFASHIANGSIVYVYDNIGATGVVPFTGWINPGGGITYNAANMKVWSVTTAGTASSSKTCAAGSKAGTASCS